MTQSIDVKHVLIVVFFPVSLHSHAKSIFVFNGLNFPNWSEQVQFYLGVLDLDLTFEVDKHVVITDVSSIEEKNHYRVWKRSNRPSVMFM